MASSLKLEGMEQFIQALRQLPDDLKTEAASIVHSAAEIAYEEILAGYRAKFKSKEGTGNLEAGLRIKTFVNGDSPSTDNITPGYGVMFGASAIVKNSAKHAWIFENGSELRYVDSIPKGRIANFKGSRGRMPPGRVFVPIVIRRRNLMRRALIDLVRRAGFEVIE